MMCIVMILPRIVVYMYNDGIGETMKEKLKFTLTQHLSLMPGNTTVLHPSHIAVPTISFGKWIILHRLLDKRIRSWQVTWQPKIYPDNTSERGNALKFQPNSEGTNVMTSSIILLCLPMQMLGEISLTIINVLLTCMTALFHLEGRLGLIKLV